MFKTFVSIQGCLNHASKVIVLFTKLFFNQYMITIFFNIYGFYKSVDFVVQTFYIQGSLTIFVKCERKNWHSNCSTFKKILTFNKYCL